MSSVRHAVQVDDDVLGQQRRARRAREALAQQEIAVAVHHETAARRRRRSPRSDATTARDERIAQLVVADPDVEQVAEHVDRARRRAPGRARSAWNAATSRRPLRRQVQVGEEQRRRVIGGFRADAASRAVGAGRERSAYDFLGASDHDVVRRHVLVACRCCRSARP